MYDNVPFYKAWVLSKKISNLANKQTNKQNN